MSLHDDSSADGPMRSPDPHAQAALLLAESTLHMLVERSVITVPDAVAVVQTAAEVKAELASDGTDAPELTQAAIELLFRISDSFAVDLPAHPRGM